MVSSPNHIIGLQSITNYKFGGAYTFDCHPRPLTFIEEAKVHLKCDYCVGTCVELIYKCAQCNFNIHCECL